MTLRNVAVIDNIAEDCNPIPLGTDATNGPAPEICDDPGQGAGIYNENILNVEQSLIANNTAKAGQYDGGYGGGIYNDWADEADQRHAQRQRGREQGDPATDRA